MATTKNFIKAVLITGLIAGTLDAAAASIQYYINREDNPAKVFRVIAGALFKKTATTGELYSWAAVGLFLHYLIATIWSLIFFVLFHPVRSVLKDKWVAGIVYALFVWCIMNFLVVPLAFNQDLGEHAKALFTPARLKGTCIGAGILIIAIGLPISLLADRYYSKKVS